MNQKLVRYELSKTIRRPAFIFALLIAVAVAIAAALEPWANLEKNATTFFLLVTALACKPKIISVKHVKAASVTGLL